MLSRFTPLLPGHRQPTTDHENRLRVTYAVVGGGVAGKAALARILRREPDARVVMVDSRPVADLAAEFGPYMYLEAERDNVGGADAEKNAGFESALVGAAVSSGGCVVPPRSLSPFASHA